MNETYIIANRTDVGCAREHNEDSMVTFESPNGRVIAVCDGMGGQAAGDVASKLACTIITDILSNNTFPSPTEAITRAIMAANQGILHRAAQNPEYEGMGATCVMVIIKDGKVYYGWVGDSRIYYIADGRITQISRDQSYVQQLVDAGQITPEEAEHHPQKNEITNALGVPSMTPPEICASPLIPSPGSIVMLCSDGLSGMVNDNSILTILSRQDYSLQKKANLLVDEANANGGTDNITVQLVQFNGQAVTSARPLIQIEPQKEKSRILLYVSIIIGALILAAAIFFSFSGRNDKSESNKHQKIEDSRHTPVRKIEKPSNVNNSPTKSSTPTVIENRKTVSTPEKDSKKTKPELNKKPKEKKGKTGNIDENFGTTGHSNKANEVNNLLKSSGSESNNNSSALEQQIKERGGKQTENPE